MNFYERKDSNNYGVYQEGAFSKELTKSFLWMFVGLILSALTSYFVATSFIQYLSNSMIIVCAIFEFILVFLLSRFIAAISHGVAVIAFLGYSILNGVTLSGIFLVYDIGSIVTAFVMSSVFFGCMAVYGFVTKKDLSKISSLLFGGLMAVLVLSIVSVFLRMSGFDLVLAYISVAVFLGLTAYDVQRIKHMYNNNQSVMHENMSIYAALQIYLDFINIFIEVLRIIGSKNLSGGDD